MEIFFLLFLDKGEKEFTSESIVGEGIFAFEQIFISYYTRVLQSLVFLITLFKI